VNTSVTALVRSIDEDDPPTLLLDEADAIFAKRREERGEGAEDLRGILNSGPATSASMRCRRRASRLPDLRADGLSMGTTGSH
jgi:hypothetical protein